MVDQVGVERKQAAEYLRVSTRTLDRYVRAGRLTAKKVGMYVYIPEDELSKLKQQLTNVAEEGAIVTAQKIEKSHAGKSDYSDTENEVYKLLYHEVKDELHVKQKELEVLHYKLGQLEVELKQTVPMLEYNSNVTNVIQENAELKIQMEKTSDQLLYKVKETKEERMRKNIYLMLFLLTVVVISMYVLWKMKSGIPIIS